MADYEGFAAGVIQNGTGVKSEPVSAPQDADVSTPYGDYDRLMKKWFLPRTLMKGTTGMREAGLKFLPKEAGETPAEYDARLNRSYLFNAFRKTVKDMTGKVFQREVTLEDDVPSQIKEWAENIDLTGRHLNVFARDVFFDGMQTGINFLLAEMPPALPPGSTKADEKAVGARPYLVHIKAEDLIGFKCDTVAGIVTLTQVRIRETETVAVGDFLEKQVDQIRVLASGTWQKWRRAVRVDGTVDAEKWEIFEEGTTSLDYIPLVPVYIHRTGIMKGEPPLEDLAELNIAHWQSQSDQNNILHFARVPLYFFAGGSDDAVVSIGAGRMIRSQDADAKFSVVEHTGAAIGAGSDSIKELESQMQTQGLQLLTTGPANQTATGEIRDEAKENSPLAMMAMALGDALEAAFGFMADFASLGKSGGSVDVNTDFGVGTGTGIDLTVLASITAAGDLSKETLWSELKRRDVLADTFDADVEKDRLEAEAPTLVPMMNLDGPQPAGKAPPQRPPADKGGKPRNAPGGTDPSNVTAGFPQATAPGAGAAGSR